MARITISDLCHAGSDSFINSESYLQNLTDTELDTTKGGGLPFAFLLVFDVAIWGYNIYQYRKYRLSNRLSNLE